MAEEMDDDDGGSDSESDSENAIELLDHGKWPFTTSNDLFDFLKWGSLTRRL